ncbi:MAG: hypothetical protein J7578_03360 [Chitinophagaceae bacterium]|nr:hypothetical protein [Chitinophagaceae bacterium]
MKILQYSLICFLLMAGISSCKKDGFQPLTDERPAIPLIVTNSTDLRPGFTVRTSRGGGGTFSFDLEIPANSGRSIKEITSIIAGTGPGRFFGRTTSDVIYKNTPIPGSGNKVSFATSLTEYNAITGRNIPANNPPVNAVELPQQFFFLVTLDDNSTLVSEPVRVLIVP